MLEFFGLIIAFFTAVGCGTTWVENGSTGLVKFICTPPIIWAVLFYINYLINFYNPECRWLNSSFRDEIHIAESHISDYKKRIAKLSQKTSETTFQELKNKISDLTNKKEELLNQLDILKKQDHGLSPEHINAFKAIITGKADLYFQNEVISVNDAYEREIQFTNHQITSICNEIDQMYRNASCYESEATDQFKEIERLNRWYHL